MKTIDQRFNELLLQHGYQISEHQLKQFEIYYEQLTSWNEKMNLTAITDREQVYMKHFYDSASLSFFVPMSTVDSLADIGSGAGFPSIPLLILYPHIRVTIIDSLNKRIQFLEHLTESLGLSKVQCIHSRAEDAARMPLLRDQFDLVTARAVARLNVLNELCLPFVKVNGVFAAMKGAEPEEELNEAAFSLMRLNGELENVHSFQLPFDDAKRNLIFVRKKSPTPNAYPRKVGVPLKNPLIK